MDIDRWWSFSSQSLGQFGAIFLLLITTWFLAICFQLQVETCTIAFSNLNGQKVIVCFLRSNYICWSDIRHTWHSKTWYYMSDNGQRITRQSWECFFNTKVWNNVKTILQVTRMDKIWEWVCITYVWGGKVAKEHMIYC